jgi:aromatic ring-cleaving dioxygenase
VPLALPANHIAICNDGALAAAAEALAEQLDERLGVSLGNAVKDALPAR